MGTLPEEVRTARRLPSPDLARAIRRAAGVSQVRMGIELGVHRLTIARWESGERAPQGARRTAYAALLEQLREASA
ncbi:helix-turn-helix domain-containing protein [Leifsonia sp. P73]|uniref:helix-turn-helix domain-containing protein n=1 Tax=Leifsonia sp. P73 TaxID=3423959 RepID=UPI003DA34009